MQPQEKAIASFRDGFNCSQSVLLACGGGNRGLTDDQCLRVACAFGAGMGRRQMTCGAVTGALMAIGLQHGKSLGDHEDKKADTYARANALMDEFTRRHQSITCRDLLNGLDLHNPDDYALIKEQNLFSTLCEKYVNDAVTIAQDIINKPS